ncbi:MAG: Swt1 family HEPN domain-containing protein [Alphaproteobacteria bacterium]|nr:Swt1 family HEPN domain-containing protein [Alphaproteobacteria bacterium]
MVLEELGGVNETEGTPEQRDDAAILLGMRREFAVLSPSTLGSVVASVGFKFRVSATPLPQAIESEDSTAVYDPVHWSVLREVEQGLRRLIEEKLTELSGPDWVTRIVAGDVRKRWENGQQLDREANRQVLSAIHYSNFMELADLIVQKKNWLEAFAPIFKNRDDIVTSLRRLHPVRLALAHNRPLGVADQLLLWSEATRVLRALGRSPI